MILHQRGFTLSDSAYLSGDIKCERANELSAEIDLLLRQLLSEAEDEIPIAELVTSLINNKANVTEENEKEDKTKKKRRKHRKKKKKRNVTSHRQSNQTKRKKEKVAETLLTDQNEQPTPSQTQENTSETSPSQLEGNSATNHNKDEISDQARSLLNTLNKTVDEKEEAESSSTPSWTASFWLDTEIDEIEPENETSETEGANSRGTGSSVSPEMTNIQNVNEVEPIGNSDTSRVASTLVLEGFKFINQWLKNEPNTSESSVDNSKTEETPDTTKNSEKEKTDDDDDGETSEEEMFLIDESPSLNFLLVLKPNLCPVSLAKINQMIQVLTIRNSYYYMVVNLEKTYHWESMDSL